MIDWLEEHGGFWQALAGWLTAVTAVGTGTAGWVKWGVPWVIRATNAAAAADDVARTLGKRSGKKLLSMILAAQKQYTLNAIIAEVISHHLDLSIYVTDLGGKCVYANRALCKLFGKSEEEMKGYGWAGSLNDAIQAVEQWRTCIDEGIPYKAEYHIERGAETIPATTTAIPAHSVATGELIGYVGVVTRNDE